MVLRYRFRGRRLTAMAVLAFSWLSAVNLWAQQTFFVSPTGSDSNSGTSESSSWRTLQFAADSVGAGDTIQVLPGNYVGFDLRTSGTLGNPISFLASPGATIQQVNSVTNRDGINLENVSHVVIDGFRLESPSTNTRAGIRVVGDGFSTGNFSNFVTLRNNVASDWGRWGIFTGFTNDILIEGNTLSGSVNEHGIYVSNSGDRPVIRGNRVFDNHANGIHINGDVNTGNTNLPGVDGIISSATVSGNIIYGNGVGGGSGINGDGAVDARIENNLLYDNHASGISLFRIDGGAASTGGEIVNNTIINADDARWVINLRNGATDATVFNNILFNLNDFSLRGAIAALEGSEQGLLSDYNLLDPRFALQDDAAAMSLEDWRLLTGNDLNSIPLTESGMVNLFEDFLNENFELAEDSLAIDFGVASLTNGGLVNAPLRDLLDRLRPIGRGVDAGSYESTHAVPEPGPFLAISILGGLVLGLRNRRAVPRKTT